MAVLRAQLYEHWGTFLSEKGVFDGLALNPKILVWDQDHNSTHSEQPTRPACKRGWSSPNQKRYLSAEVPNTKVYIGNLPSSYHAFGPHQQREGARAHVERLCQPYGKFNSVSVNTEQRYGFVTFTTHEAAQNAIDQLTQNGQTCEWAKQTEEKQMCSKKKTDKNQNREGAEKKPRSPRKPSKKKAARRRQAEEKKEPVLAQEPATPDVHDAVKQGVGEENWDNEIHEPIAEKVRENLQKPAVQNYIGERNSSANEFGATLYYAHEAIFKFLDPLLESQNVQALGPWLPFLDYLCGARRKLRLNHK